MKKDWLIKTLALGIFFLFFSIRFPIDTNANPINISINEGTQYWALLIAVGIYADNPDANFPSMLEGVDDLYDILLISSCWSTDQIKVIKGKDATVINIIQGLRWLDKMEDKDDISLIYITTHGGQLPYDIPPRDEADGYDEVLASYWSFAYPFAYLSDDIINFLLNRLESKGVCLIVDSCYAGGFNDTHLLNDFRRSYPILKGMNPSSSYIWMKGFAEDVHGNGRVILMSCRENEESNGYFTQLLNDGLRGYADSNMDDIVSAEELFSYLKVRIFSQHPTLYDDFPGELPLVTLSKGNIPLKDVDYLITREEKIHSTFAKSNSLVYTPQVCGYVRDNVTGGPINHAFIDLSGIDTQGNHYNRQTYTNVSGFYILSVLSGSFNIVIIADGYFWNQTSNYEIDENEMLWVNISLDPYPAENSVVCGYVTDNETNDPVTNAEVTIHWSDNEGHELTNKTNTNLNGYYSANVAAGYFFLYVRANGYFNKYTPNYAIGEYDTIWINVSLESRPPEHSVVCGYIIDSHNGEPIKSSFIKSEWQDGKGHIWNNYTTSTDNGFYTLNSSAGEVYLYIYNEGYCSKRTYRNDVEENETLWVNISLLKDIIQVDITKPLKALYILNHRVLPFSNAIIIGRIDIEVFAHNYWFYPINAEKVEFYIDGVLRSTDVEPPYIWTWKSKGFIKHGHSIKVIAYDANGNSASDEIQV